jgi:protein-tyrosine-phosphatase
MYSVLFVCTANVARSPVAEGLFVSLVEERNEKQKWLVDSAGTWAVHGQTAAINSRLVLQQRGIDFTEHLSKVVTRELISQFNLILTMEIGHKEALRLEFPEAGDRIYLLSEMVGLIQDVHDPIGGNIQEFQEVADLIEGWLTNGYEQIRELAAGSV